MIFETRTVRLKTGESAILRSPTIDDAEALLKYRNDTARETDYLLYQPDEIGKMTLDEEAASLRKFIDARDRMMILCEVDKSLAGCLTFHYRDVYKTRHRGDLALSVYRRYWGLGIGSALLDAATQTARDMGLMQLELDYVGGNDRAGKLYEKNGFTIMGIVPNAYRMRDGGFSDAIMMVKQL